MSVFPAGYNLHFLAQVGSTNLHAMELVYAGLAGNGDVFTAGFQSEGKGQRGKAWQSAPNESILMSLVLDTSLLSASQSFRLSASVALSVKDFLQKMINQKVSIKWPNDLFIGDRKAGGILIENLLNKGSLKWSIIGVGLNINQPSFPDHLPNAVSLRMITGESYDCASLITDLTSYIDQRWQQLKTGGWPEIISAYNEVLYGSGTIKRLRRGSVIIPCLIKYVNNHGLLVAGENEEWRFEHGEVEWLPG